MSTPAGDDAVVRATVPVKPPVDCKVTVDAADPPTVNETLPGFADNEKSGPVTVTAMLTLRRRVPFVPVTVTV